MIRLIINHFLLLVFLISVGTFGFFAFTTPGLELILAVIASALPGKITIQEIDGTLFSAFSLKNIKYQDTNESTKIASIDIAWRPLNLITRQFNFSNITLGNTTVELLNDKTPSHPFDFQALSWLKFLKVDQTTLSSLSIEKNHQPIFQSQSLLIAHHNHENYFYANMLNGKVEGKFSFNLTPRFTWAVNLSGNNLNPYITAHTLKNKNSKLNLLLTATGDDSSIILNINQLNGVLLNHLLKGQADIRYADKQLFINKTELHIADTDITVTGSITDYWNIHWNANIPNLSSLIPDSKGSLKTTGSISGARYTPNIIANTDINHLSIAKNKIDRLMANLKLSFVPQSKSSLTIDADGIHVSNYDIKKTNLIADGNFSVQNQALRTDIRIAIDHQTVMFANIQIPDIANYDPKISGSVLINVAELNILADFIPGIKNPQGHLQGEIRLDGLLSKPSINGKLNLNNGKVSIPQLGINLEKISLQSSTDNLKQLHLSGSLQSGEGTAQLKGTMDLSNLHFHTLLSLHGNNLQVIHLDHYNIIASPELDLSIEDTGIKLKGSIHIPEAEITPTDFSDTITMPDDVVFVGEPQLKTINYFANLGLEVDIILGEKITFQYQDLQTTLGGKIQITQDPGSPATASGELYTVKGTYRAYGKLLDIQQGRLIYTGNTLTNPGLTIRAVREIKTVSVNSGASNFSTTKAIAPIYTGRDTVSVGVQIQGTVQTPIVALYANPTMSQGDMLSYLLFGYPQSQATSGNQLGALLSATSVMQVGNKTPTLVGITQGIQDKFGLNELTVGSTEVFDPSKGSAVATTSFMVGKQLAKNLYLHYSIGLFNPISILNLRYQLTKRWSIQSETSTIDNGADLQYGFERD